MQRRAFVTKGSTVMIALASAVAAGCRSTSPAPKHPQQAPQPLAGLGTPVPMPQNRPDETVFERAARFRTLRATESVPEFVMCPPTKLHSFNNSADVKHWQWLTETIRALGGKVNAMKGGEPNTGYGEVWTRDPILAFPDKKVFFMGTYPPASKLDFNRKIGAEAQVLARKLEDMGFRRVQMPHPSVDGGEVHIDTKRHIVFIGYEGDIDSSHNRNRWDTAAAIERNTGYKIVKLQRDRTSTPLAKDADFYHLDCGMGHLPDGKYLVSESALTPASMRQLQDILQDDLVIVRDKTGPNAARLGKNALNMSYNFITVGRTMIMPYCSPELASILEGRQAVEINGRSQRLGYTAVSPERLGLPGGCWKFSNGSVHCATNQTAEKVRMDWTEIDRQLLNR